MVSTADKQANWIKKNLKLTVLQGLIVLQKIFKKISFATKQWTIYFLGMVFISV